MTEDIESPCWICGSRDITYVDVLACPWCSICFERIYLAKPNPDDDDFEDCY